MIRKFGLIFAFLVVALPAGAKTFYVAANQVGTGSGSGCSTAKPVSWFNNAASWGTGTTQIGPATTVHLCGTFTAAPGANLLTFHHSGASGAPITLLFEPGAVLQAPYFGILTHAAINTNGNSWIIIDGGASHGTIRATANGSSLTYHQNSLAIFASNCSNCEFRNLTIANMYIHSSLTDTMVMGQDGCIMFTGNQSNVSIHGNIMHDVHWCLAYSFGAADSNLKIYGNTIYNTDHAIALAGTNSNSLSNVSIYNNHIYSYKNWDTGASNTYHHDGIHAYGSGSSRINNVAIYNNQFNGPTGQNITGHIFIQSSAGASGVVIYNNVFTVDSAVAGIVRVQSGNNDRILNNTFISTYPAAGGCFLSNGGLIGESFENNVMSGCFQMISLKDVYFLSGSPNHNIYAEGQSFNCGTSYFSFAKFPSWQTCIRGDLNSSAAASAGLSSTGVPLSGSIAIGKAVNLSGSCSGQLSALCKDKNGYSRPASGTWDAGAYQHGTIAAPTGLTATIN
jgi:hypothetical protein